MSVFTYPIFSPSSSTAVKSLEEVDLNISGAATTAALTKGQDPTQCVPFFSMHYDWDYSQDDSNGNDEFSIDIFDDAGTPKVTATKYLTAARSNVKLYIVEFTEGVNVQKLSYTSTSTGTTVACDSAANAFIIPTGRGTADSDDWEDFRLNVGFNSPTEIFIGARASSASARTGYLYVVDDPSGDLFAVQEASITGETGTSFTDTISSVDLSTTMLLFNFSLNPYNTGSVGRNVEGWLSDATTISYISDVTASKNITAFVVTWKDGTTVQHISDSYTTPTPSNPGAQVTRNLSLPTPVEKSNTVPFHTNMSTRGLNHRGSDGTSWSYPDNVHTLAISADGTMLDTTSFAQRFSSFTVTARMEVVTFKL